MWHLPELRREPVSPTLHAFGGGGDSYRKISGDTCSGGDVEMRLEGELVPCPLAGERRGFFPLSHRDIVEVLL